VIRSYRMRVMRRYMLMHARHSRKEQSQAEEAEDEGTHRHGAMMA
jgi:hypothetical protein